MTINHLNLIVSDVTNAVTFFETYFEFQCQFVKGEGIIAVLKNKENFSLVIMSSKNENTAYPKDFHLGFMIDHAEEVDTLYQRLISANIEIAQPPRKIRDSYGFYFHFDNLFIEIGHYLN